ncbi:MAG TPA: oxidoreductase [Streptosporangiaceae bacterium]|nr:oxidoreductase [Streptosporangiaceae bacterium]
MSDPFAQIAALPGVADAVLSARSAVDRLLGHRILRRRGAEVSAESALRGARASAALEGRPFALEDVRAGGVDDPVMQGALRVSAEVGALADTWRRAPRQVLARLHTLAAADMVGAARLGRPRAADQRLGAAGDLHPASEDVLDLGPAPAPAEVTARLDALLELILGDTEAPAIVVGAIVHGELMALRPFGTCDGLVARAAQRATIVARGLDPKSLVAPEVGHAELEDAYAAALRGYVAGTPAGVAGWVRHCAEAVSVAARDSLAFCEALQRG